jgi:metal-responsive CopG/Arc/MetJ family transcriptional regulator
VAPGFGTAKLRGNLRCQGPDDVMKSHVSATIDAELVEALHKFRKRERRSLSNVLEAAVSQYLKKHAGGDKIIVSPGVFTGTFSRRDTYAKAKR